MRYIHAKSGWPSFQWSADALSGALAAVRHHQGMLFGRMSAPGRELDHRPRSQSAPAIRRFETSTNCLAGGCCCAMQAVDAAPVTAWR